MHDPYGHAHMDDRPRLQVRKRPAQSQEWDAMSDEEPGDDVDDNYEGDDDDGEDSNSQV